jgi:D-alanyl-D-alanine carboxypeptidase
MKACRLLFGIICCAVLLSPPASAQVDSIDSYIRNEMATLHIPGLALLVVKNGRIVKSGYYGLANVELNVPVNEQSSFEIASMSKQLTDAAMLLLVEEGKVRLDDSVTQYLAGLPETWRDITIRRLMDHTSGLRDDWDESNSFFLTNDTNEKFLRALAASPLKFNPGDGFRYSCGPFVVGMVIEKVAGMPYSRFMQERILAPLQMTSTHVNDPYRLVPNRASGYAYRNGVLENGVRISPAAAARADVGIRTTALDLAKWDAAIETGRLLKRSSWKAMFTPARLKNGAAVPSGFGWYLAPVRGHPMAGHGGRFRTGYSSTIRRYLDDRMTIIVLTNAWAPVAGRIAGRIAGFYNPDYRPVALMSPKPDPDPRRTERLLTLLQKLDAGGGDPHPLAEGFPAAFYEPDDWRSLLDRMKAFSFVDCQDVSERRPAIFGARVQEICFYKVSAEGDRYVSFSLTADGRIAYIEPYEH